MSVGMNWVRWMYREEVLHTSVLAHLLSSSRSGEHSEVGAALIEVEFPGCRLPVSLDTPGPHDPSGTDARRDLVVRESRVSARPGKPRRRRTVDLSCRLVVDEVPRRLLVETKVDSAASREQLDEMSWRNDHTILLALGKAAFDRSQADLDADADIGFTTFDPHLGASPSAADCSRRGSAARSWSVVAPDCWHGILERARDHDAASFSGLESYVERIAIEAKLHQLAESGAAAGRVEVASEFDSLAEGLEDRFGDRLGVLTTAAFGAATRAHLRLRWSGEAPLNVVAARDVRTSKVLVFPDRWTGDGLDVFLELMVWIDAHGQIGVTGVVKASGDIAFRNEAALLATSETTDVRASVKTSSLLNVSGIEPTSVAVTDWVITTCEAMDGGGGRVRDLRETFGASTV